MPRRARTSAELPAPLSGDSAAIQGVLDDVEKVAPLPVPLCLTGESGVGKGALAQHLHQRSDRTPSVFVPVPLTLLSRELAVAQLVGHARGAFTGAASEARGFIEQAHAGTLFLDEVGEATPELQCALLTLVEDRTVRRLGEERPRHVDVRIVCATNRDLEADVAAGRFRRDLFYRIGSLSISIPPLRERREDIPAVIEGLLPRVEQTVGQRVVMPPARLLDAFATYEWPGNVRELEKELTRWAVWGRVSQRILKGVGVTWRIELDDALERADGNRAEAARQLGVSRQTVYRELKLRKTAGDRAP